jgi:hypothetical protein
MLYLHLWFSYLRPKAMPRQRCVERDDSHSDYDGPPSWSPSEPCQDSLAPIPFACSTSPSMIVPEVLVFESFFFEVVDRIYSRGG